MALIIKNKQSIDLKTDDAENKAENKRSYSLDDFLKWRNEQQKKQGYSLKSFEEWEAKKNEAETVFKEAEEAMREAALNQTKAISAAKQFVNPETPSNVVEKVRVDAASELLKPNTSVMQRRDVGKSGITLVDEIAKEAAADVAVKEAVRDYGISAGSPNKSVKEEKHANVEKAKQALAETKVARSETSDSINQKLRETIESDPVLNRLVTDYWQKAWEYSQPIGEGQTAAQADAMRDAAYEDMMQAREVLTRLGYDADALKDAYAQVANKEETEKIIKDYTEYAKEHPVSATVKSIGLNAAGSLSALSGMLESTIKGEDVDTNSPAYAQLNAANALREGVSEDLSPGAQFAYNTGISMADSLLMMPMGTLGTVVMGANALAQTSKDVLDKGGTKAQAWATGLVAGIAETLLEKVSLDQLKVFAKMPGRGFLAFMKNVGKGMVTEGSEELFTEIVNVIGDALINGGNSDIEQRYNDYVKSGMNKEAAWKQTAADYAKQMGLSFLGGAVSGGVFGAGSQLIGDLAQKIKDIDVGKEVRKMGDAEISAQVEEGLKAEDGTEQKRVAEKLNKKLTENEEYSDADVGAVAIENTRARVEKVETQMAASPELEKEIESADKEAGNSIARTAITDLYVRANRILEGEIDLARSSEELDRTADAVRSNKKLSDSQKNAIIKAVDNVKERLTETAESRPKQAESAAPAATEVTPEVMAEREARAAKATNEIERSGILSGADDKQIKEVMGIADVFRQHGSTLKVRFSADYDVINGTPNGIYAPTTNTIYVNPKAKNPFAQVIAHELVHRMAYNSGNLYNDFLRAVTAFYSSKGISIDQLAKQKVKEYATFGIALDENQSREEVAAAFVEEYVRDRQAIRSLVRKHRSVAEWFRLRLRGLLGWLKPQQTKEARYLQDALDIFSEELRGVDRDGLTPKQRELKAIDDQYASGEITGEEHDRLAAEIEGKYGESYSISADVQAEYERNVDAVLDGTYSSPDPLIVGRTPDVLRLIGFAELPVVITPNHIYSIAKTESEAKADGRYNARTNYHGLGERAVKDIMKSISNPLMVVMAPDAKEGKSGRNSAHRVIVITETMVDGKRVVSPIEVDADVRMNDQYYDTNLVASYYAKDSLKKIISEVVAQETIGNTAIYYGDKKRISDFVKDLGFQLPAAFKDIRNSIRTTDFVKDLGFQLPANFKDIRNSDVIIRDIGENVNKGIENVTQSKQFKRWFGDWQNDPARASKVVNKDGTPKVVYHGTNAEFNEFDSSKNKNITLGNGHYFGENKSVVEKMYGSGTSGRVIASYLNIKNPFVVRSTEFDDIDSMPFIVGERTGEKNVTKESIQSVLKANGYDGVRFITPTEGNDIWVAFDPTQIKSATENVGTFSASNSDIRYSISPAVDENGKQKIAAGMSDEQRYDILKGKSIRVAFYDKDKYEAARPRIKDINVIRFNDAYKIGKAIANEFGAIRVYENSDIELEFEYTNNGVVESMNKQRGRYDDYVKFLTIAEHVIENAKGLECHTDRYSGTPRADITNAGDFILIGAFEDEDGIVPVKLLVKQFTDKPNKLYVAITVNKIEAEIVTLAKGNTAKHHPAPSASTSESEIVTLAKGNTAKHHPAPSDSTSESEIFALAKGNAAEHHPTPSDSEYSLTQILENVNPADKTLIKYIPDGFLDDAQLAAKAEAIKEERDYVERKTGVSYSISFDGAIPFTPPKEEEGINTKELEDVDEEYILDEADAEVAVPYEDEEGNLRFISLKEAKAAEKRYYDLLNQTGRLEHDLNARKEAIEQGVKILQDKYVSLDKIKEAMDDGSYAPRMIAVHKKLKEYENTLRNAKEAKYTPDIDKYTELAENTAKYIEAVGRRYRQLRDNESLEALGNFHEWEGKEGLLSGLRYATETPTRIIEDIAPNEAAAKRMLAYAFDPVRKNEANRQRWIRDLRARVKALKIGTKKEGKNANTESEAVQLVGEYMHIIDLLGGKRRMYGMDKGEWQKALDDFKAKNPDMKWPEVESKAKAMREIYDEIYDELSNVLVTNGYPPVNKRGGYFPHFSENEPDSVLGKAAAAIGLQIQGNELPTSIYGLTANFKPGKSYFGNLNRRTGNNTTYDALRGFEIYINGASNVIHHTDDIQRLRSLARVIRKESADPDTKKKIEELVNARDGLTDEQKDMQINEMLKDAKFKLAGFASWLDEYTNGLANKKSKYDRSMEELLGRTIYSLVGQLEGRVAANMVALNPGSWLTNFIPLTQARALIGDKYMLKAAAMAVANAARDDGFTDMSDFLVSRKGSDPVVMAMSDRVSSFLSRPMEWIDGFASQTIVRARYMQNVEKHGMSEEAAMAEANVFAGKVMADRSKGATPTIFNSKNPLIKVFTQFQIEQNNQLRYLLKDIPKETEKAQRAILALMGAMMKFAVGAYLFNDLYEYFIGRRPAFDILGIVNNTFGSAVGYKLPNIIETIVEVTGDAVKGEMKEPGEYFETKKKGIAPALGEGGTELLENLPFVGGVLGGGRLPIANAIGNPLEVAGEALALIPTVDEETGEVVQNGSWQRLVKTAYDELSKPIYYLAPKFGGGQMKKVLEGTFAVAQHGSYTYNKKGEAQLQYPVLSDNNLQTALNWGAAVIFGKTTTPWAREWIENSFKTRTVGETAAYKAMIEIGEQSSDAYAVLDRVKEAKAEHSRLDKKGNSPYDSGTEAALAMLKADNTLQEISKAQVYKHLLASSDEKEYLYATIRYQDPGLYRVLTGMRDVTAGGDVSAKAQKQELILNSDLSDAAKVKVYRVKAASDEDEEFMDRMKQQGVSEITTLKVITKAGAATKNSEKYKAVSTTTMTESQRNAFMKQIMTDSQYSKYNLANSKGITTAVWAQFTARLEAVNASGAASQQEAAKALAGMNITQNQKAAIWQLQNKGWKAENNPFNPKVGALIKEQME